MPSPSMTWSFGEQPVSWRKKAVISKMAILLILCSHFRMNCFCYCIVSCTKPIITKRDTHLRVSHCSCDDSSSLSFYPVHRFAFCQLIDQLVELPHSFHHRILDRLHLHAAVLPCNILSAGVPRRRPRYKFTICLAVKLLQVRIPR